MATNGKRNREAGHQYEKDEMNAHKKFFPNVATTRSCNRQRDSCGIDLANPNEIEIGRFPIDISMKTSTNSSVPYIKLFQAIESHPQRIKAIFHRYTQKPKPTKKRPEGGKNFVTKGEYVVLEREGYEILLHHLYAMQLVLKENPALFNTLKNTYDLKLLDLSKQIK